jgi:hypothetical protein
MKTSDLLYEIFEQQLFTAAPMENEAIEPFVNKVVHTFIETVVRRGYIVPTNMLPDIEEDLSEEVLEMTRKKTYGYLNISDYRKAKRFKRRNP